MVSGLYEFEHTVRQLPSEQKEVIMRSKGVDHWVGYPSGQYSVMLDTDGISGEDESPWQKIWVFLLHEMCVSTEVSPGMQLSESNIEAVYIGRRVGWKEATANQVGQADYSILQELERERDDQKLQ